MGAAVHLLEPVDETRLAEAAGRQPAGHEGKADRDGENAGADRGQSHQRAPVAQRRQPVSLQWIGWIILGQSSAPRLDTALRMIIRGAWDERRARAFLP